MFRDDMSLILQMQERPQLAVSTDDDMTTAASIATIRTTFRRGLVSVHVRRTLPTLAGSTTDFDVVNKVLAGHGSPCSKPGQTPMAAVSRWVMSSIDPTPSMPLYLPALR